MSEYSKPQWAKICILTSPFNLIDMDLKSKIYIAGHRGLAGSAIVRELRRQGYTNLVMRTHAELDLEDAVATQQFFEQERPEVAFLAAAKVGGIHANSTYPVEFLMSNLLVEASVCRAAYATKVNRLIFLGSSCIYPRDCPQPIKEEYLLTGPLEATNRAYALAKIAGIEMCWSYNREYGTKWLAAMPTNLYGPGDSYDLNNSHVLPALIRKMHEAKVSGAHERVAPKAFTEKGLYMLATILRSKQAVDATFIFIENFGNQFTATLHQRFLLCFVLYYREFFDVSR